MADSVLVKFKSLDGSVHELSVAELIEVDGLPFAGSELQQQLDRIEYRLEQLCVVVDQQESE